MELFEALITRRSVRKYMDIPVEWDKVGTIMEAGRWAPSAGNLQNWKFITIDDRDMRKQVAEACLDQHWIATAPMIFVIVAEPDPARRHYGVRGERLYSIQNAACAAYGMMLAAHSLGLGTCWIGAFDEDRLRSIVNIPDNVRPQCVITCGYPDEVPQIPWKYSLEDVHFFSGYGGSNKIKDVDLAMGYTSQYVRKGIKKGAEFLDKFLKRGDNK